MLERIKLLMDHKSLTASQFADSMEVPRAIVSHILSGRNKPSLDVILKIAGAYPDVNLEWLLLGSGEMLTTLAANTTEYSPPSPSNLPIPEKPETEPAHQDKSDKVQSIASPDFVNEKLFASKKAIIQVMIFYSDGTFEDFRKSN